MSQLQEVRASRDSEEARVSSLRKELQDTSRELGESLSRNNRQVSQSLLTSLDPPWSGWLLCRGPAYLHRKYVYSTLALEKEREIVKEETALRKEKEAVCCYVHVPVHVLYTSQWIESQAVYILYEQSIMCRAATSVTVFELFYIGTS